MKVNINKIKIKKRIRSDLGTIDSLAESIRKYGLLNPLTITSKNHLVAGYRRLMAVKQLGWQEVECTIIPHNNIRTRFEVEVDENMLRKNFTIEELAKIEDRRKELSSNIIMRVFYIIRRFFIWLISLFRKKRV